MSQQSSIEWTDATWNPVRGCVKVSPGCANCYAETFAERWRGVKGHAYEQGFDLRLVPEKLEEPLRRKKPTTYFVNSMSDLFQDGVPDEFIDKVFAVMALTPQHTYQVLTKRPERMHRYLSDVFDAAPHDDRRTAVELALWELHTDDTTNAISHWPLKNVWLGVSVENQHFADERIPLLLQTPAAVRFISAEPLLAGVDIARFLPWVFRVGIAPNADGAPFSLPAVGGTRGLDWVIVGGESGHGARPFDVAWARSIVCQCQDAGVPVFVKQIGAVPLVPACRQTHWDYRFVKRPEDKRFTQHDTTRWRMRLLDPKGGDMDEWPEDLRVREFPASHREASG